MTDNGRAYRSKLFNQLLDAQGVKHKYTCPYRPQTNGKVERFNRTLLVEWAYVDAYDGETARTQRYPGWLHDHSHHHRPHRGLGGLSPVEVVYNLTGHYT